MKEEAQRIAIAEALEIDDAKWMCQNDYAPDYLNDLNAMHSAVASQPMEFRIAFDKALHRLADERELFVTMLEASDWAGVFIGLLNADGGNSTP